MLALFSDKLARLCILRKFFSTFYMILLHNFIKEKLFLPRDRVCSIFSGAGKFCLVHGLRQLTRDFKSDVRTLNFKSDVTYAQP